MNPSTPLDSGSLFNAQGIHAYLRTQGYAVITNLLPSASCSQMSEDIRNSIAVGPTISTNGTVRVPALLAHSDTALEIINDESFGLLIDEAVGVDAVLSRAEGFITAEESQLAWRRDFDRILRTVPSRRFTPGLTVLIALDEKPGRVEIIRSSHLLKSKSSLVDHPKFIQQVMLPEGSAVLLAGVYYRHCWASSIWLNLAFIRPWIKPDILLASALQPDRIAKLNSRGQRWCGLQVGLPTSVEEFLEIEAIALNSDFGRGKGSGI